MKGAITIGGKSRKTGTMSKKLVEILKRNPVRVEKEPKKDKEKEKSFGFEK